MQQDHYTNADVLEDAADYIEKHGLNQDGEYAKGAASPAEARRDDLPVCTVGAIAMAVKAEQWSSVFHHPALSAVTERLLVDDGTLLDWSDNSPQQEVLDTLRLVAKEQRILGDGA